jgi:trans-aconitate methyltransferase
MAHDQHDHHDHHHHEHHSDEPHHHWDSADYVQAWIARNARRQGERQPIIERLIAAVPFPRTAAIHVLDVGGGAGVIAEPVLSAFPHATVTVQDYSQPMLDGARKHLNHCSARVRYVLSDLRDPAWTKTVGGPFDLAVSGIAIHNLYDVAAMAACYEAIHSLLKSGGCFLDYDHFDRVGGTPLHQHMLKVAGFASAEVVWHEHPTAIIKANV